MFGFKKNKEKTYKEDSVRYVLLQILQKTIDRKTLKFFIEKEIKPIVGKDFINQMYTALNLKDIQVDDNELDRWMEALDEIEKRK